MDIVEWRPLFTACPRRSEDHWGQNVTIVQNDPIIFRVMEKNAQTGFNPPIWTKNSQKNQGNSKLKKEVLSIFFYGQNLKDINFCHPNDLYDLKK